MVDYSEFENYVNYAGSKTLLSSITFPMMFENYVNYAGSKTLPLQTVATTCLRTM